VIEHLPKAFLIEESDGYELDEDNFQCVSSQFEYQAINYKTKHTLFSGFFLLARLR